VAEFFNALRDVNRQVCIDTYVQFHLSRRFRRHPDIEKFIAADFLRPLCRLHDACQQGRSLSEPERRTLFEAHFFHEQDTIVGETVDRAARALTWPLAKFITLRPRVRFAYLPPHTCIPFHNFADRQERIQNGLRAFDVAARVGWRQVERSLAAYGLLDSLAVDDPDRYFARLVAGFRSGDSAGAGGSRRGQMPALSRTERPGNSG
jgi:hypothetical protein